MLHDNNLIEMSLRLNRSEPLFRTIRELPGIGKRHRTRYDIRLHRNLPFSFMVVRQKPTQTFIFRILLPMNLDFHLLKSLKEIFKDYFLEGNKILEGNLQ